MEIVTELSSDLDQDLGRALHRYADAIEALYRGQSTPYASCWARRDATTLYGAWGPIDQGRAAIDDTLRWVASRCSDGSAGVVVLTEVAQSGDLAYSVGFERITLSVDRMPPRHMVLRVTQVYRRHAGEWAIVHRHADEQPADQRRHPDPPRLTRDNAAPTTSA